MEAIVIGIGCNNNFIISQSFNILLNTKTEGKIFKLFIFKKCRLFAAIHIFWLTTQRENSLIRNIPASYHRTCRRISLSNKNHTVGSLWTILQMIFTILKLFNLKHYRFFCFTNLLFGNTVNFVSGLLIFYNLIFQSPGHIRVMSQPVINSKLDFLNYWCTDFYVSKFIFCLAGKHWIIKPYF